MAHPYHHALSSVRKWGGKVEDYIRIHDWFDESKKIIADFRHRALRHHAEGIFMAETIFGSTITLATGRVIPVRWIGEQHVREDLGFIPSFADWVKAIRPEPWMGRALKLEGEAPQPAQPAATAGLVAAASDLLSEAIELLSKAEYSDGQAIVLTHDCEALQRAIVKADSLLTANSHLQPPCIPLRVRT